MPRTPFWGFLKRITLAHAATYLVAGLFFMQVMGYGQQFAANEAFAHFRPLTSPIVQAAVLFQIARGALFGLLLYPFRDVIIEHRRGWLYLWGLILGLTSLGAVNAAPGSIEGFIYTETSLKAHLLGYPEVITQTFLFSFLFHRWERRRLAVKD